jgi:hypothetical protein
MSSRSIDEVYEKNAAIGEQMKALLSSMDKGKLDALPKGEKWTIANIAEHVSMVEAGIVRICEKLLSKAESENQPSEGAIALSESFGQKAAEIAKIKLEAPEYVHPSGEKSIEEVMDKFAENQEKLLELKPMFEKFDSSGHRFPHPYLGNLSAGEWLILVGRHKMRHIKQMENLAGRI